jgi:hypothetical protein
LTFRVEAFLAGDILGLHGEVVIQPLHDPHPPQHRPSILHPLQSLAKGHIHVLLLENSPSPLRYDKLKDIRTLHLLPKQEDALREGQFQLPVHIGHHEDGTGHADGGDPAEHSPNDESYVLPCDLDGVEVEVEVGIGHQGVRDEEADHELGVGTAEGEIDGSLEGGAVGGVSEDGVCDDGRGVEDEGIDVLRMQDADEALPVLLDLDESGLVAGDDCLGSGALDEESDVAALHLHVERLLLLPEYEPAQIEASEGVVDVLGYMRLDSHDCFLIQEGEVQHFQARLAQDPCLGGSSRVLQVAPKAEESGSECLGIGEGPRDLRGQCLSGHPEVAEDGQVDDHR